MIPSSHEIQDRIDPYILMGALNQPIDVAAGRFKLACDGRTLGSIEARLYLRWHPTTAMEFDGEYSGDRIDLSEENVILDVPERGLSAHVIITSAPTLSPSGQLRGVFRTGASVTTGSVIDRIRFCLVNFPEYLGDPIQYETEHSQRGFRGRLRASCSRFSFAVDAIPEVSDLRKSASHDGGFVISHVGELKPQEGYLDEGSGKEALDMLHLFFGFLRGAWAGPVFPQGFSGNMKNWEWLANWKVSEPRKSPTWLPQMNPLNVSGLFDGFVQLYHDKAWRFPLERTLDWYIQANSSNTPNWTKLVVAQVALDLLAWMELVNVRRLSSRKKFKGLGEAGRMRALFERLKIPWEIPSHLTGLQVLLRSLRRTSDVPDGPDAVKWLRDALVHGGEKDPAELRSVSGVQWWQAGQLALQYVELSILALCGYQGMYARRGWQGSKGDDEALVPWAGGV